jgi:uncharacterized protein (DUF305 family)
MEPTQHNSKKAGYVGLFVVAVGAFLVGYLLYPELHQKKGMHRMSDGSMMEDSGSMKEVHDMQKMMHDMNANLVDKTGDDFDVAFLEEMIPHHLGAIEMAELALATSKRPELIQLAKEIIAAQQKEINMMRDWQRTWFGVQAQ